MDDEPQILNYRNKDTVDIPDTAYMAEFREAARKALEPETADGASSPAFIPPGVSYSEEFTEADGVRLRKLLLEAALRRIEALQLYEPLPLQKRFHESMAKERIIRGSNRSGKTVGACVEVARALTGQDPFNRYPKENGIWYSVSKDGNEIGQVMFPKLYRPGAFRIIRDLVTKKWRAFLPNDPEDILRKRESRPAPPLIPRRFVKTIAWEDKKKGVPSKVTLTNGWEHYFYSSNAAPTHGTAIDGANFDEEISNTEWYSEVAARLVDKSGWFIWSATPQAGTDELYRLHLRAQEPQEDPPLIEEFEALIDDNEFIGELDKRSFASKLSEEELSVRIGGQFGILSFKVFPEFSITLHGCPRFPIPDNWTRYAAIDPGRQVCAGLFLAIPDPEDEFHRDFVYLFDELYIKNCDAEIFGERMAQKVGHYQFEDFLIDHQYGRMREAGSGEAIEELYARALAKRRVACRSQGSGFTWAVAEPSAGVEASRLWLRPRDGKPPRLKVMVDALPNFLNEIKYYRYTREKVRGVWLPTNKPEGRGPVHLMACWRYLVQSNPIWVEPPERKSVETPIQRYLRLERERNHQGSYVRLGPCGGA